MVRDDPTLPGPLLKRLLVASGQAPKFRFTPEAGRDDFLSRTDIKPIRRHACIFRIAKHDKLQHTPKKPLSLKQIPTWITELNQKGADKLFSAELWIGENIMALRVGKQAVESSLLP